jgi:hypothetical protein
MYRTEVSMRLQSIERWTAFLPMAVLVTLAPVAPAAELSDDGETTNGDVTDARASQDAATDSQDEESSDSDGDGIPDDGDECPAMAEDDDDFRDDDGCPEEDDWTVRSMEYTVGAGTVVATAGLGLFIAGTVVRMRVRSQLEQGSTGGNVAGRPVVDRDTITQREAYRRVNLGDNLRLGGALAFGLGTVAVAATKVVAVLDNRTLFTAADHGGWRLAPRVGRSGVGLSVEFDLGGE